MPEMSLSEWYKSGGHLPPETSDPIPDAPSFGMRDIFAMSGMPKDKADALAKQFNNKEDANFAIGGSATKSMGKNLVRIINDAVKAQKAAIKDGDIATALAKQNEIKEAIKSTVNSPAMPRAKPLSDAQIQAFAERMAPQITGELTRGKSGATTVAGKTQQQFQREKTLPIDRTVLQGAKDPMAPLPEMTLEQQKGGVLLGLPGDPTLARMQLSGIGDVAFERPVTLYGGPRYGDDEKLWASNIAGASNLVGAGRRASQQYGGAPVYASFMKMPEGFGFAHHYLDSLLQYTRPDQLPKAAKLALEEDIRKGFKDGKKKYEFPEFAGFDDLGAVSEQALRNSKLRGHIADRLEKSKLYGLRPAGDVEFAVTHPELTNIETGAGGFTIGELPLNQPFSASAHPTYTHDIPGKVLGQTRNPTPYDLLYRDQLEMVKKNPVIADEPFGTVKLLGARQKIDEQLINEINEYQERLRQLTGKKEGGLIEMAEGGQAFPLQDEFQAEMERRRKRPRTRAGVPVDDTNVIGGAATGLMNTLAGGLRGRFIGTVGVPGDIVEGMSDLEGALPVMERKAKGQTFPQTYKAPAPFRLPTMEDLDTMLPSAGDSQEAKIAQQLGQFMPLTGSELAPAGRAMVSGAKKAGSALTPALADMMEAELRKSGMIQDIIKPEGGNWVKDATKKYVDSLRIKLHNADPAITLSELETKYGKEGADEVISAGLYPNIREHSAINNFIDKKLTRYLQNEMGSASDPVRLQADTWQGTKQQLLADKQKQIDKVMADIQKAQQARNVEPEVLTRSQARLRELEHEKSLIEHRKGLHYDLPQQLFGTPQRLRGYAGMPQENVAKSQVGKNWEDVTDKTIRNSQYKFQIPFIENDAYVSLKSLDPQEQIAMIRQMNNESLRKLGGDFAVQNPEAYAYSLDSGYPVSELGFDHLVDELRGALINDALPNNLRLTTKTLDKMSVPQAVEHVDKINAWRAAQKAEVNKARAANAATVVHKEYPEAGMKWVELKIPEMTENFKAPDRYEIKKPTPSSETFAIWDKENQQYITSGLGSEEAAIKHLHQTINQGALEDALKYEGEILQHCVGGYCPDVISGKSRIYSLRDESGRPHATVEVQPKDMVFSDLVNHLGGNEELANDYLARGWQKRQQSMDDKSPLAYAMEEAQVPNLQKIKQIKGEGNRAPKEDLQPFVQDFVKSGDWSQVGDLQNTGLQQTKNAPWRKRFEDAGIDVPNFVSDKEYENLVKQYFEKTSTPVDPKFMQDTYGIPMKAQGGTVRMAKGGSAKSSKTLSEWYLSGGHLPR